MAVCSAFACKNSYRKGFSMKRFPRDPERKKQWAENMNIADFKPTDNSYLCEVHFPSEMWEKTTGAGLKKLKRDAVPTIFPEPVNQRRKSKQEQLVAADHVAVQLEDNKVLLIPSTSTILVVEPEDKPKVAEKKTAFVPIAPKIEEEKTTTETSSVHSEDEVLPSKPAEDAMDVEEKSIKTQTSTAPSEDEVSPLPSPSLEITVEVDEDGKTQSITGPSDVEMSPCPSTRVEDKANIDEQGDSSASLTESTQSQNKSLEDCYPNATKKELRQKLLKYEKMYAKQTRLLNEYKRRHRNLNRLVDRVRQDKAPVDREVLNQIFNEDQIRLLRKGKPSAFVKWSKETIAKGFKLRHTCGANGYEELLKQGYPLPSVRTLQRSLYNLKSDIDTLTEVLEYLDVKIDDIDGIDKDCDLVLDEVNFARIFSQVFW